VRAGTPSTAPSPTGSAELLPSGSTAPSGESPGGSPLDQLPSTDDGAARELCAWAGRRRLGDGELQSPTEQGLQFWELFGFPHVQLFETRRQVTSIQHIVLSCTNRKRRNASPSPRLRDFPAGEIPRRVAAWTDAVSAAPSAQPVKGLYLGEYWRAGADLALAAERNGPAAVSVLSAGLGLVGVDDEAPSYAATFTSGHPDSVCVGQSAAPTTVRRQWWDELAKWRGPAGHHGPRRLVDLAGTPGARLLVCVGPDYLDAVADDLRAAHKVVGDDRLVILAAGEPMEGLSDVWVRCPGQLRMRLGGSMASTGVRAARALIESARDEVLDARHSRKVIARWMRATDPLPTFKRTRMTDDELLEWIRADAVAHPGTMNRSAALRRLRDHGQACEQGRFGRLYDEATGATG
jgi:hypothetical protein